MKGKHLNNEYSIPLRFLHENRKSANILHLYCLLRKESIDRAGYVPNEYLSTLTRNQRDILIPKLIEKGWGTWIRGVIKLTSVQKIIESENGCEIANFINVKLKHEYLSSVKRLKEFIFASVESYILKGKYISETKGHLETDRETKKVARQQRIKRDQDDFKTKRLSQNGELSKVKLVSDVLSSKISRSMLANWGYNEKEVSRLRKGEINRYKREFTKNCDKYAGNCFFSNKSKSFIKCAPTTVISSASLCYYFNTSLLSPTNLKGLYKNIKYTKRTDVDLCIFKKKA